MKVKIISFMILLNLILHTNQLLIKDKSKLNSLSTSSFKILEKNKEQLFKNFNKNTINTSLNAKEFLVKSGWMKYIEINEQCKAVPNEFNKNDLFNNHVANVLNEYSFYIELTSSKLGIYKSNESIYKTVVLSVDISTIIKQTAHFTGGLEDIGNFNEGFCFIIKYVYLNIKRILELCSSSASDKNEWMYRIENLIKTDLTKSTSTSNTNQNSSISNTNQNSSISSTTQNSSISSMTLNSIISSMAQNSSISNINGNRNGWIPAADWSDCSKPCDSGKQRRLLKCISSSPDTDCIGVEYEERLCNISICHEQIYNNINTITREMQGKWEFVGSWSLCDSKCGPGFRTIMRKCIVQPCEGPSILKESCMNNPCNIANFNYSKNHDYTNNFDFKNYEDCKPKLIRTNVKKLNGLEYKSDLLLTVDKIELIRERANTLVIPMNEIINIRKSIYDNNCYDLIQLNNSNPNIPMVSVVEQQDLSLCDGSNQSNNFLQMLNYYRSNCQNKLLEKVTNELNTTVLSSSEDLQSRILHEREMERQDKIKILESKLSSFKTQTKQILQNEEIFESNLINQQNQKMNIDIENLKNQQVIKVSDVDKFISDVVTLSKEDIIIKEKEEKINREMQMEMNALNAQINQKRQMLIKRMQGMKVSHEYEKRSIVTEQLNRKKEIGMKIVKLSKEGNASVCFTNLNNFSFMSSYCNANVSDIAMRKDCMIADKFCYICCNTEFGVMHYDKLNCCQNRCDANFTNDSCFSVIDAQYTSNMIDGFHPINSVAVPVPIPPPIITSPVSFNSNISYESIGRLPY